MEEMRLFRLIFTGVWCLVGVIFFLLGFLLRRMDQKKRLRCSAMTTATVVDYERRHSHQSHSSSWYPVLRYYANGWREGVSNCGTGRPRYEVGSTVTVFYDPETPGSFYIEGDKVLKLVSTVFLIVGVAALAIGLAAGILVTLFASFGSTRPIGW